LESRTKPLKLKVGHAAKIFGIANKVTRIDGRPRSDGIWDKAIQIEDQPRGENLWNCAN
jgi:hypothetical protein